MTIMICKICSSKNIKRMDIFKPYIDKEWSFELVECLNCNTRFARRDNNIEYHEELHSLEDSPYAPHYIIANEIKELLRNDISKVENILNNKSLVIKEMLSFLKRKNKSISILEIGCSSGYVTAYLQKIGFHNACGVDISSSAINYARTTFGNYYALKEKNKKYDVIFHTGLIGCVDDPIQFLNHYLSQLTSDGVMFFNAPNVDSVKELNETWVSTPPPDLIYLFKDNVFKKVLDKKYDISIKKTLTPITILRKYINKYKGKKNNIYPRKFYNNLSENKASNQLFKSIVSYIVVVLVKLKILKHYSDDYGLIIKIKHKEL